MDKQDVDTSPRGMSEHGTSIAVRMGRKSGWTEKKGGRGCSAKVLAESPTR
jgi:hypothetical protein